MTPERWQLVKSVFQQSLELPVHQRSDFISAACAADTELQAEVQSLLDSHDGATGFLETPALARNQLPQLPEPGPGDVLGVYRIVQKIGEGGMSMVYQAIRDDDQFRKLVAVKILKRGMDTEQLLRRFHNERQILAHFDHPHIAKLLDGGTTPDGRPYFVMEFIAGESIDTFCDSRRLPVRERLNLFLKICAAVEYAHQNLVVHRDLKPRNILVTADGDPKLLDFGIAKLLADEGDVTAAFLRLMTPDYASPEQIRGDPITTASDVYSLGVVLFVLLTGQHPFRLGGKSLEETARIIADTDAPRVSTAVSRAGEEAAELRDSRPDRLRRLLSGDLDNIVATALRKEPTRRYASVEQLSADIRRHLEGQPILARAGTFGYRAQKFVIRHRAGVAATLAVILALTAGIVIALRSAAVAREQRLLAEHRFDLVRKLANSVMFEIHDSIEKLPGSTQSRELLVRRAQEYLDSLARQSIDDPTLQQERAEAYLRIGDVLGNPSRPNLGNARLALDNYTKSRDLARVLVARDDGASYRPSLATVQERICSIQMGMGNFRDALVSCGEAVDVRAALSNDAPGDNLARANLAYALQAMAAPHLSLGDFKRAKEFRLKVVAAFEELVKADPQNTSMYFNLGVAYTRLAGVEEQLKEYPAARDHVKQGLAVMQTRAATRPEDARAQLEPTFALQRLGSILIELGDLKGALEAFQTALPIRRRLAELDPLDARAQLNLANNYESVGFTMMLLGDAKGALEHHQAQRKLAEGLLAKDSARIEHHTVLAVAYEGIGSVSRYYAQHAAARAEQVRHWKEARPWFERALKIFDDLEKRGSVSADLNTIHVRLKKEIAECTAGAGGVQP